MTKRKGPTPRRQWEPMERARQLQPGPYRGDFWKNDRYTAIVNETPGGGLWLSVRRNDRKAIRDWRDLQEIKNDIAGPEREAFELFPAESRLVDTANQYHLWVQPVGVRLPVGWNHRVVTNKAGQLVMDGHVLTDDEINAALAGMNATPDILAKAQQRPRTEETTK